MSDPQDLANKLGASWRATEQAIKDGDLAAAADHAEEHHGHLKEAFVYATAEQGLDLDWNAAAGNDAARGGGAKTL